MFSNVNYYKKHHTKYNRQHYYLPGFLELWIFACVALLYCRNFTEHRTARRFIETFRLQDYSKKKPLRKNAMAILTNPS